MSSDQTFRWVLMWGALAILPVAVYHRIRSQLTGESLDRTQEGWFILITLRLAGLATAVGIIVYLTSPIRMAWSSLPLPEGLRWAGAVLIVLTNVLLTWTLVSLGKNLTDTVVTRREHSLVTSGPYRWV